MLLSRDCEPASPYRPPPTARLILRCLLFCFHFQNAKRPMMIITSMVIPRRTQLYLEFKAKGKPLLRSQSLDSKGLFSTLN
jgi:hypothetical protein